jgi:type I restriction enzyme S subunit
MKVEAFFENFELLTDAPNAVDELRAIIRQLAIRGKLTLQISDDEPALKLIEETQKEKKQPIKEKKLRATDSLPEIELREISYEIPERWEWVRFGNITICRDGERIPLSRDERATRQGEFDYYGASGVIDKIDDFLFDKPLLLIGEDGANLINRSTPIAFIASGKYWVNNHAHVLDAVSFDCLRYLELYFNAIDLKPFVTGTAQPKMNQAKMNSIPISLPPLGEQKRIVEKCDRLLILCDEIEKRRQQRQESLLKMDEGAIAQLLTAQNPDDFQHHWQRICNNFDLLYSIPETIPKLRQAILQLAVQGKLVPQELNDELASVLLEKIKDEKEELIAGKKIRELKPFPAIKQDEIPFAIPKNWLWVRMQEIFTVITDGDHQAPPQTTHGVPFLVISNVRNGFLNFESTRFVSKEFFLSVDENRKPIKGDILYSLFRSSQVQ